MKTERNHNSEEWHWSFHFSLPKWLPVLFWYMCVLTFGFLVGWLIHSANVSADEDMAYNEGYASGKASCDAPTRLEKGAKAFSGWLSDRD